MIRNGRDTPNETPYRNALKTERKWKKMELVKSVTAESVKALLTKISDICLDAACVCTLEAYSDALEKILDITGTEEYSLVKLMEGAE